MPIDEAKEFFSELVLDETQQKIASRGAQRNSRSLGISDQCGARLSVAGRTAPTLSGGETQRIRLAGQIGCGLVGVLYILDEPSIGLHPRDNERLLSTLEQLRDQGNTVVVVEHDEDTMRAADLVVDFGPGAGVRGGELMAVGTADQVAKTKRASLGPTLAGRRKIEVPQKEDYKMRAGDPHASHPRCRHNNLKNVDLEIPWGRLSASPGRVAVAKARW